MMQRVGMMKSAVLLGAILAFSTAAAQAQAMKQGQLDRLDRDRNGAVDRSEYQAFMTSAFANLDKNKDGMLSREEAAQTLNAQQFAATDADGDGTVAQEEFLNRVMADFEAADRSGDGSLQ